MENNEKSFIARTSGLNKKDYLSYALGDVSCCLVFGLVTTILQKFYTDILFLSPLFIMFMMFFARIWDAINDPIMGRIVDVIKPSKKGRYVPWFLYAAIPLAISTILMMLPIKGFSPVGTMVWATVTYVMFGMSYTTLQIPYGSLASVVTTDEKERTNLSTWRSVGATLGSMPVILLGMLCNKNTGETVEINGVTKNISVMDGNFVFIASIIFTVISFVLLIVAYKNNKERVVPEIRKIEKGETLRTFKKVFKSKAFIAVSLSGMLLLAGQMFSQSFYLYLFDCYFQAPGLSTVPTILNYLPMAILMFFTPKLVRRFGKKELCGFGGLFAAFGFIIAFLAQYVIPANNRTLLMIVFLVCCLISGVGLVFMTLQVWAMATDAIDDIEVKTGERNEGSAYSIFMFFRKLGQALAAIAVNGALIAFGYTNFNSEADLITWRLTMSEAQQTSIYNLSTLIPAVIFGLMGLILLLLNPLSKKKVELLQEEKEAKLKSDFEQNKINIQ